MVKWEVVYVPLVRFAVLNTVGAVIHLITARNGNKAPRHQSLFLFLESHFVEMVRLEMDYAPIVRFAVLNLVGVAVPLITVKSKNHSHWHRQLLRPPLLPSTLCSVEMGQWEMEYVY